MAENKWVTRGISPRNKWNYGPLLVITGVINPISKEKQPQLPIYFRPFVGVIHIRIYNWFFGPHFGTTTFHRRFVIAKNRLDGNRLPWQHGFLRSSEARICILA